MDAHAHPSRTLCMQGGADRDLDKASVQFLAERAELLLRVAASHGLRNRTQALQWLGSHFRVALEVPQHVSDYQVGLRLGSASPRLCLRSVAS